MTTIIDQINNLKYSESMVYHTGHGGTLRGTKEAVQIANYAMRLAHSGDAFLTQRIIKRDYDHPVHGKSTYEYIITMKKRPFI